MLLIITSHEKVGKRVSRAQAGPGIVIDFSRGGDPIGIELTAPRMLTLNAINRVLRELGLVPLKRSDLAPLLAHR